MEWRASLRLTLLCEIATKDVSKQNSNLIRFWRSFQRRYIQAANHVDNAIGRLSEQDPERPET